MTCTNGEGAGVVVPGTGVHVNNIMGEQDLNPLGFFRYPPGRRMPSMMSPTVVLGDGGDVELVLGSAGSNRIRSAILQVIVGAVDHGLPASDAVLAPRVHFEDGVVYAEPGRWRDALRAAGPRHRRRSARATCSSAACRRSSATRRRARWRAPATRGAAASRWRREAAAAGRPAAAAGALAAALTLAACGAGAPAHDLFLVQRGGAIPGAKLALRVTDDGRASCNRGPLVEITSAQLIDARELQRDLEPLAKRRFALAARAATASSSTASCSRTARCASPTTPAASRPRCSSSRSSRATSRGAPATSRGSGRTRHPFGPAVDPRCATLSRVTAPNGPLADLRRRLAEISDLERMAMLLAWDQEVMMPAAGAEWRAQQRATLERLAHERFADDHVGALLEASVAETPLDEDLLRVARRDYDKARRVPGDLVEELAHAGATGHEAWTRARESSDFALFEPHLRAQHRAAPPLHRLLPRGRAPLRRAPRRLRAGDAHRPGRGRPRAPARRPRRARRGGARPRPTTRSSPAARSRPTPSGASSRPSCARSASTTRTGGWTSRSTRSPATVSPGDVRLTTRYAEDDLDSLFCTLHEFGHGLYEANIDTALARSPLGTGVSSAVHESQSRLWENMVGRSPRLLALVLPAPAERVPGALRRRARGRTCTAR